MIQLLVIQQLSYRTMMVGRHYAATFSGELVSACTCIGVVITLDDTVIVNESEVFTICLNISEVSENRERDVYVSLIITSETNTEGNNFPKEIINIDPHIHRCQ